MSLEIHYIYPDVGYSYMVLKFLASDIVLHIDSGALYLSKPRARSSTVGHYYIISQPVKP